MQFFIIIFIGVPLLFNDYLYGIDEAILCWVRTIPEAVCWSIMPPSLVGIFIGAIGLNAYEDSFWTGEIMFFILCFSTATLSYIIRVYG